MTQNYKRGFTLIELLVVIAIIGILAGIVLAALGNTRQKGADAGIQGNLDTIRTQAEVVAGNNSSSYQTVCTDTTVVNALTSAKNTSGATAALNNFGGAAGAAGGAVGSLVTVTCHSDPVSWAAESPLKSNTSLMWCADSTGKVGTTTTFLAAANDTTCN